LMRAHATPQRHAPAFACDPHPPARVLSIPHPSPLAHTRPPPKQTSTPAPRPRRAPPRTKLPPMRPVPAPKYAHSHSPCSLRPC
ncbi:hypothetical protein HETIRDRAFT_233462, partial [Heterobasidion irregulare TC 32-1]